MRAPRCESPSSVERYARSLRFALGEKDLTRLEALPFGELVLLLRGEDDIARRVVIHMQEGSVSVSDRAADHYVPQAIVECALSQWIEYARTGAIADPDCFDLFGSLEVLDGFLRIHRLEQRPVGLRCHNMLSRRGTKPRPLPSTIERTHV